jgi:hypothetical protein
LTGFRTATAVLAAAMILGLTAGFAVVAALVLFIRWLL